MSAFLVSVCMSAPSDGYIAMPIEAVVWHSWPLSCKGWLSTDKQLAGDAFDLVAFGGFLQNDDEFVAAEPRHDVARTQRAAQPPPISTSSMSPASWPSESLMTLNRSRSMNSTANCR